ncbi:MAG: error-prone DNA polymerase [Gammaproteobacteria bacterium]|nr:error-prone DNA polymerase [Gammaproteobacteria bacterium]
MTPAYAELHTLSNFTFLRGASHPEELVRQAIALGYTALALTDECSLAGAVRAWVAAKEAGLRFILGSELTLDTGERLVVLAPDATAYAELASLITYGRRQCAKGEYRLSRPDLVAGITRGLLLSVPNPLEHTTPAWLAEHFAERAWLAVELFYSGVDQARLATLTQWAAQYGLPLVASGDVHMHLPSRQPLCDVLTAIRLNTSVQHAGYALFPNSERHLRPRSRLAKIYPAALLAETIKIAERCQFTLAQLQYQYPRELVPAGETASSHLRKLTVRGMRTRWPAGVSAAVSTQIEHELTLIAELRYEAFFLTVYDIVRFARSRGILCQGRGSAANSAVCYCLGVTEVDPARMEMLFERFISRERGEPPDIDVDFEHERREEVIQYIYRKYGRRRAALAATVITYKARSAVRDVGKALGLALDQVDRLAENIVWWDDQHSLDERLREVGFDPANEQIQRVLQLVAELIGFPRHLSQHVGGFVISDGPLDQLVPIENAAMPERTVIQWDKDDLEALGLLKVDCLCLGMLSAIRRACVLIAAYRGAPFEMADIPDKEPATYAMIQRADTVGVFQIESRAQMAMLPRLKPAGYYDLVIQVAIVRPGPIQGEMVHPYLRRRNGEEKVTYPSDAVRGVLERTLGVPLFQEQVIKLAIVAAGFNPGEADQLRRSMGAWKRNGRLEHFREKLLGGMRERGYPEDFAVRLFNQIQGFGEYGFPESHAASFALLAYASAWLKCHEPAAFLCALLNSQPMGFYAPAQLVQDARRHGVTVLPPDVLASDWECTLVRTTATSMEPAVRLGLCLVKGLSAAVAARVVAARTVCPFTHTTDLGARAKLDRGALSTLARAGALASLSGHRHRANWAALGVTAPLPLLPKATIAEGLPLLRKPSEGADLVADYANLGLTLGRHPLALLRARLDHLRCATAFEIMHANHGEKVRTAGLVISRQRPETATGVVFVTLEDETGVINLIVWSSLVETQRRELLGARLLGVSGQVQREGIVVHLIAERLFDHSALLGRLSVESRDFH